MNKVKKGIRDERGFTLIELIAVFVIIGVMSAVLIKRVDQVDQEAALVAIHSGVKQLNTQELLQFVMFQLQNKEIIDAQVFTEVDCDLGPSYKWSNGPTTTGGTLKFNGVSKVLKRTPATPAGQAKWEVL